MGSLLDPYCGQIQFVLQRCSVRSTVLPSVTEMKNGRTISKWFTAGNAEITGTSPLAGISSCFVGVCQGVEVLTKTAGYYEASLCFSALLLLPPCSHNPPLYITWPCDAICYVVVTPDKGLSRCRLLIQSPESSTKKGTLVTKSATNNRLTYSLYDKDNPRWLYWSHMMVILPLSMAGSPPHSFRHWASTYRLLAPVSKGPDWKDQEEEKQRQNQLRPCLQVARRLKNGVVEN